MRTVSKLMHSVSLGGDPKQTSSSSSQEAVFTPEEVAAHHSLENNGRVWTTLNKSVYDVTDFVPHHPGGKRMILLAAGTALEPFWAMYASQHYTPQVQALLNKYRIGRLSGGDDDDIDHASQPHEEEKLDDDDDAQKESSPSRKNINKLKSGNVTDPFANEPLDERVPEVPVLERAPYNAGNLIRTIPEHYLTPAKWTYVRNHHPVPSLLKPEDFRLTIGDDSTPVVLTLEDLRTLFRPREVIVTLICSGYRRAEFVNNPKPILGGVKWDESAVSTAAWKGVLISDLRPLIENHSKGSARNSATKEFRHVWFIGRDEPYDASIPVEKAFDPKGDALLAYEMNGLPIPRDHGGPVRIIVPGHTGARSVKWVKQIKAAMTESPSPWQIGPAYKVFSAEFTVENPPKNPELTAAIQEYPCQSAISTFDFSQSGESLSEVLLKGWAWSGGGRRITRVEASADGGKNWHLANLGMGTQQPQGRAWAWTFWTARIAIPIGTKPTDIELVVRASDESSNWQPESARTIWNLYGNLNNSYYRVRPFENEGQDTENTSPRL